VFNYAYRRRSQRYRTNERHRMGAILKLEALEDRVLPSLSPQLLKDLNLRTGNSSTLEFVTIGGTTFFDADDGIHGRELWRSNGTAAGTAMVADINVGAVGSK